MANFNKVFLMGNLTRDPQLSYLPSQRPVVEFGLAINRRWTGRDGEKKESTCFIDCRAFDKRAEVINQYLSKGRPVFIEGRLDFDTWTAQDGSKRSKHRVTVENFEFLGGGGGQNAGRTGGSSETKAEPGGYSQQGGQSQQGGYSQQSGQSQPGDPDDDIPF